MVIDDAKDELCVVTLLSRVDTLPANEEENVTEVLFTSVILAANDELLFVRLL